MIYSTRALPEENKSRIHEAPKNNGLIFHMGEVSGLWRKTIHTYINTYIHKPIINSDKINFGPISLDSSILPDEMNWVRKNQLWNGCISVTSKKILDFNFSKKKQTNKQT